MQQMANVAISSSKSPFHFANYDSDETRRLLAPPNSTLANEL